MLMPSATNCSTISSRAGAIGPIDWENGFQTQLEGHNGGGDSFHTDGRLAIAVLNKLP